MATIAAIAMITQRVRVRVPVGVRSPAPLAAGLALHALHRPRQHLEPRQRNALSARGTQPERVLVELAQRAVDVVDRLARGGREREVSLPLHVHRVALARLLVELGVALLALAGEQIGLGRELVGLAQMVRALLFEAFAQLLQRAGCERRRQLPGLGRCRHFLDRLRLYGRGPYPPLRPYGPFPLYR